MSTRQYCVVEFAGNSSKEGALVIDSTGPFINYSSIRYNPKRGICGKNCRAKIKNCSVYENSDGGIIFIGGGSSQVDSSFIYDNHTTNGGGISQCLGPAYSSGKVIINKCSIYDNSVSGKGGGVYQENGAYTTGVLEIYNCDIIDNNAGGDGGAICQGFNYNVSSIIKIVHCKISDNRSKNYSAIKVMESSNGITTNTITQNICTDTINLSYSIYIQGAAVMTNNNIINTSSDYEIYNNNGQGTPNVNCTNNYWGTTVETEIQAKIYDWFDDNSLGIIEYSPWLTAPEPGAPPIP